MAPAIAGLLLAAQPPVDWMTKHRDLSFSERMAFDQVYKDKRVPSLTDVLGAEKVLARFRCIGPLRRWRRTFSFTRNPDTLKLDPTLIGFEFIQAGHDGKPAGRRITTLDRATGALDDRQFKFAHGVYSTRTRLATLTFCNWNHPRRRGP
jgi:hypothetical protein